MIRTVIIILTFVILLSFATPAAASDIDVFYRAMSCTVSDRVPTERMLIPMRQYINTGDTDILLAAGWGVGYDGYGRYFHYFGLKCYEVTK